MSTEPISTVNASVPQETLHVQSHASSRPRDFWHELIARVASTAGIDPDLATRVATQESGINPNAQNPKSGALGMMQLMPATAAALGVDPRNPVQNVVGGVRYLREQLSRFGDEAKALAAYNWGPGRVAQAVERWGSDWLSHAPRETQHYVAAILSPGAGSNSISEPAGQPGSSHASQGSSHPPNTAFNAEVAGLREALNAYLVAAILE